MYSTLAYPLRSCMVCYKRTLPKICKIFAEHVSSNPCRKFFFSYIIMKVEGMRSRGGQLLSFLAPLSIHNKLETYTSLRHFLKNLCQFIQVFHNLQKAFYFKKIYFSRDLIEEKKSCLNKYFYLCPRKNCFKQSKDAAIIFQFLQGSPAVGKQKVPCAKKKIDTAHCYSQT